MGQKHIPWQRLDRSYFIDQLICMNFTPCQFIYYIHIQNYFGVNLPWWQYHNLSCKVLSHLILTKQKHFKIIVRMLTISYFLLTDHLNSSWYKCYCYTNGCSHQDRHFNTLRPRQNSSSFPDKIFKHIFLNENVWILTKISPKFCS